MNTIFYRFRSASRASNRRFSRVSRAATPRAVSAAISDASRFAAAAATTGVHTFGARTYVFRAASTSARTSDAARRSRWRRLEADVSADVAPSSSSSSSSPVSSLASRSTCRSAAANASRVSDARRTAPSGESTCESASSTASATACISRARAAFESKSEPESNPAREGHASEPIPSAIPASVSATFFAQLSSSSSSSSAPASPLFPFPFPPPPPPAYARANLDTRDHRTDRPSGSSTNRLSDSLASGERSAIAVDRRRGALQRGERAKDAREIRRETEAARGQRGGELTHDAEEVVRASDAVQGGLGARPSRRVRVRFGLGGGGGVLEDDA
eukprot:31483-Pelagococcus_subviridis.AAC.6